ncbi:hypothetical protein DL98DRAFT_114901 [Cadophora sp. DSE1049]|nr:hypothetical protein DL98DRAFT_114901 [Cadophora sp. DSE1049]
MRKIAKQKHRHPKKQGPSETSLHSMSSYPILSDAQPSSHKYLKHHHKSNLPSSAPRLSNPPKPRNTHARSLAGSINPSKSKRITTIDDNNNTSNSKPECAPLVPIQA